MTAFLCDRASMTLVFSGDHVSQVTAPVSVVARVNPAFLIRCVAIGTLHTRGRPIKHRYVNRNRLPHVVLVSGETAPIPSVSARTRGDSAGMRAPGPAQDSD